MSAQESTAGAGRVLTHAHATEQLASSGGRAGDGAATADFSRDFEWGEVDSTSSGFSFSDSDNDLLSKAVTAGALPPPSPHHIHHIHVTFSASQPPALSSAPMLRFHRRVSHCNSGCHAWADSLVRQCARSRLPPPMPCAGTTYRRPASR